MVPATKSGRGGLSEVQKTDAKYKGSLGPLPLYNAHAGNCNVGLPTCDEAIIEQPAGAAP